MSSDHGLVGENSHWSIAFLSIARLDRYLRRHKGNFDRALADYAADLKALGELMILINIAEIAIRNSVVGALQRRYGRGDIPWHDAIEVLMTPVGKKSIQETKKRIRSEGRTVSSATVTAGMTLGFWVSLFGSNYEPTFWTQALAVPERRDTDKPEVQRGEALFTSSGCAMCHVPEWRTGKYPAVPIISNQRIRPYTDLLLHDMGPDLADGRPDYKASGSDWRTPPLWGIGLSKQVSASTNFLHDGRARNLTEAILWHGGEAEAARNAFAAANLEDRKALITFLESL